MRVPSKSAYDKNEYRLNSLSYQLMKANEIVTTGNQINSLKDDPVALTRVLDLKSTIRNLDQLHRNMDTAHSWLTTGETALQSTNELIRETKTLSLNMMNASVSANERSDAIEYVDSVLSQAYLLANTEISGRYIFAGTDNETQAFSFDDDDNPTEVVYNGNNVPFKIKSGEGTSIEVGRNGEEVFWDTTINIDEANNKLDFIEYPANSYPSDEITAEIPEGEYTKAELATALQNAMNAASQADGFNVDYVVTYDSTTNTYSIQDDGTNPGYLKVDYLFGTGTNAGSSIGPEIGFGSTDSTDEAIISDNEVKPITVSAISWIDFTENGGAVEMNAEIAAGSYTVNELRTAIATAMNGQSAAYGNSIDYQVQFNEAAKTFSISGSGLTSLELLWATGTNSADSMASVLGFNAADDGGAITHTSDVGADIINIADSDIVFIETVDGTSTNLTATIPADNYTPDELADEIETQLEAESAANGNGIDYEVSFDAIQNKFVIEEYGVSTLDQLRFNWTASDLDTEIGFTSSLTTYTPNVASEEANWGIFDTLIDLKGYLEADDTDGINRTLTRLDSHYKHMINTISDTGHKMNRVFIKENVIAELDFSLSERRASIEEADIIEAVSNLKQSEFAYEAALASTARIMQISLVDYL